MYDTFSSDYDRFVSWPGRLAFELPFLTQQIRAAQPEGRPARVLDAACGTGMHAIALAQQGFETAGADLSAGMIERALQNARSTGVRADFKTAGFGELARAFDTRQQPFDALLCLGNSLPHVLKLAHLQAALADFAACLRPGGLLLAQNRNFDAVLETRQRWMEPQAHREGDNEWLFLRFYDFEPGGLINFHVVTLRREGAGPWSQSIHSVRLYPLRHDELVDALSQAGFRQVTLYGGLDGSPYDSASSGNLVVTAFK